jgi:hypothetical protein
LVSGWIVAGLEIVEVLLVVDKWIVRVQRMFFERAWVHLVLSAFVGAVESILAVVNVQA